MFVSLAGLYLGGCAQLAVIETGLHHPGATSLLCTASTSAVHQDKSDIAPLQHYCCGCGVFLSHCAINKVKAVFRFLMFFRHNLIGCFVCVDALVQAVCNFNHVLLVGFRPDS